MNTCELPVIVEELPNGVVDFRLNTLYFLLFRASTTHELITALVKCHYYYSK